MKRSAGATSTLLLAATLVLFGCARTVAGEPHAETRSGPSYTQADLARLLLSDAQINTIMGATAMSTYRTYTGMPIQPGEVYSHPQCAVALFNTTVPGYHASGYVTARGKKIAEPAVSAFTHDVDEAVVAFENESDARAFVDNAAKVWRSCAGTTVTYADPGGQSDPWSIGAPSSVGQIIAGKNTSAEKWECGHAMTTRANLVVDVDACGYTITDEAIRIAEAIARVAA